MQVQTDYKIGSVTVADFDELTAVWEASVRATHDFLSEDDILFFKPLVRDQDLFAVDLHGIRDEKGHILGFLGTSAEKVEMLFIHPWSRGRGLGRALLQFAVFTLQKKIVDVNEQNKAAVAFYRKFGFTLTGRSETDGLGKPYPLLTLHYLQ